MYPSDFEAAPAPIRITLLAALCHVRQAEITDGLVELLVQLVHKISVRAEKKVEGEINAEFRRVHGKNGILVKLATAALELPEEIVRKALYPVVGKRTLEDIIAEAKANEKELQHPGPDQAARLLLPPLSAWSAQSAAGGDVRRAATTPSGR